MYSTSWLALATLLKCTHAAYIFYTVTSGDTQSSLAWRYHVTAAAIKLANPQLSDADYELPGEVVQIPAACSVQTNVYIAVPGDTMTNIAKAHGVDLAAIQKSNPQITNPDVPNPGDCIELSGSAESSSAPLSQYSTSTKESSVYSSSTASSLTASLSTTSSIAPPSVFDCTFTITTSGGISRPAGQLDDGQIRLNGSYPTAKFTLSNGQITDSTGKGCIITGPPETQFQCDAGKPAVSGFAVRGISSLTYNSSSTFYACPATDTEYNVYINPDFGQTKCFQVALSADGCGTFASSSTYIPPAASSTYLPPSVSTAVSTSEVTNTATATVTESNTTWQMLTSGVTNTYSTTTWATYTSSAAMTLKNGTCPCETESANVTTSYKQASLNASSYSYWKL